MEKLERIKNIFSDLKSDDNASWVRTKWGGDFGSNLQKSFTDGRVLFYLDVAQKLNDCVNLSFSVGVAPFPKLDENQDKYYISPYSKDTYTFTCIPKCTSDREMSDYFLDVISWTGNDYILNEYYSIKEELFNPITKDQDLNILKNYIFSDKMYDVASICNGAMGIFDGYEIYSYDLNDVEINDIFKDSVEPINNSWKNAGD